MTESFQRWLRAKRLKSCDGGGAKLDAAAKARALVVSLVRGVVKMLPFAFADLSYYLI